jgi:hypothetical protein
MAVRQTARFLMGSWHTSIVKHRLSDTSWQTRFAQPALTPVANQSNRNRTGVGMEFSIIDSVDVASDEDVSNWAPLDVVQV